MNSRQTYQLRLRFIAEFGRGVRIIWPILSAILILISILGFISGRIEHWSAGTGLYFAFITGFTVGFGDVVPSDPIVRVLAVCIAFLGIVMTALIAAIAVRALDAAMKETK